MLFGATGVGKSTLAQALGVKLRIRHITGTGVLLNAFRALQPNNPALRKMTTVNPEIAPKELEKLLYRRAKFIAPVVNFLFKRYSESGIPLIIEGQHVFPPFLKQRHVTLCVALQAPPRPIHMRWVNHPTTKIRLEPYPIELIKKIDAILLKQARAHDIPIIRELDLAKRIQHVQRLLRKQGVKSSILAPSQ